jgi:phosphoglycerate dehydrogenase-like enzyme
LKLLVIAPESFAGLTLLRERAIGVDLVVGEDFETLKQEIEEAEAVALAPRHSGVLRDLWREAKRLRWVHTLGAGVEPLMFEELIASDVTLTNSRGVFADALGEFAIAAMLWFAKDLRRLVRQQEKHLWQPYTVTRLEGQTAGIVGLGGIGRAVARRAAALGMRVIATRRHSNHERPNDVARMFPLDELDHLVAESDYLVACTPLTPHTRGLLSASRLQRLKTQAVLINISRGEVVDEPALTRMLSSGRLRGAALDVFEQEPLPPKHPLWTLDNVLLSPHTADHASDSHLRSMQFFIENFGRYRRGEPLQNVVDKGEQY